MTHSVPPRYPMVQVGPQLSCPAGLDVCQHRPHPLAVAKMSGEYKLVEPDDEVAVCVYGGLAIPHRARLRLGEGNLYPPDKTPLELSADGMDDSKFTLKSLDWGAQYVEFGSSRYETRKKIMIVSQPLVRDEDGNEVEALELDLDPESPNHTKRLSFVAGTLDAQISWAATMTGNHLAVSPGSVVDFFGIFYLLSAAALVVDFTAVEAGTGTLTGSGQQGATFSIPYTVS